MGGFGDGFWTPYTIALVGVTVVLLVILVAAIGYILFIMVQCLIACMLPVKRETCTDEVFGELQRESRGRDQGTWQGMVPFHHEPTRTTTLQLNIDADAGPPTEDQRNLFRQIVIRYHSIWPDIAAALAANHLQLHTVEAVTKHIDQPIVFLYPIVANEPVTWSLDYTFDADHKGEHSFDDGCDYSVNFIDWKITDVDVGD